MSITSPQANSASPARLRAMARQIDAAFGPGLDHDDWDWCDELILVAERLPDVERVRLQSLVDAVGKEVAR
jgi:hypothetical protein